MDEHESHRTLIPSHGQRFVARSAALICAALAISCHVPNPSDYASPLNDPDRSRAMQSVYAFWRGNRLHDSTFVRSLSTSDQPLRYAQPLWDTNDAFADSTNVSLTAAYRARGIEDTVFVEVDLLHMKCQRTTGGGDVHWRFLLLPKQSWLIAR